MLTFSLSEYTASSTKSLGSSDRGGSFRERGGRITMPVLPGDPSSLTRPRPATGNMSQIVEARGENVAAAASELANTLVLTPKLPPKPPPRSRPSSICEAPTADVAEVASTPDEPTATMTMSCDLKESNEAILPPKPPPRSRPSSIAGASPSGINTDTQGLSDMTANTTTTTTTTSTSDEKDGVGGVGKVQASAGLAALFGAPKPTPPTVPPPATTAPPNESTSTTTGGDEVPSALNALFGAKLAAAPARGEGKLPPANAGLTALFAATTHPDEGKKSTEGSGGGGAVGKSVSGPPLAVPSSNNAIPRPPPLPEDAVVYLGASAAPRGGGGPRLPDVASMLKGNKKKKADVPESKHKANRKMKGLFWTALQTDVTKSSSLWSKVDLKKLDDLELDYSELENSFSQVESSARPMVNVKTKVKEASVLDMTRTQNVEISSRSLNRTPEGLVRLVLELDPGELTAEVTEICLSLVPTPSDVSAIRGYSGPEEGLGKAGQLLKALIDVPRLKERLECHKVIFTWNKTMDSVKAANLVLGQACRELTSTDSTAKLSKLLSVILAVGNFMNGGSSRVAAAVKLDSILKLNTVKAASGQRGTLLHFVVKQLQQKYPDVLDFYADWTCVTPASNISLTQLFSDKKGLMVRISYGMD